MPNYGDYYRFDDDMNTVVDHRQSVYDQPDDDKPDDIDKDHYTDVGGSD